MWTEAKGHARAWWLWDHERAVVPSGPRGTARARTPGYLVVRLGADGNGVRGKEKERERERSNAIDT